MTFTTWSIELTTIAQPNNGPVLARPIGTVPPALSCYVYCASYCSNTLHSTVYWFMYSFVYKLLTTKSSSYINCKHTCKQKRSTRLLDCSLHNLYPWMQPNLASYSKQQIVWVMFEIIWVVYACTNQINWKILAEVGHRKGVTSNTWLS